MPCEGSTEADFALMWYLEGFGMFSHSLALRQPPAPSTSWECRISRDVIKVLLPGTGHRLSVVSESQTGLGAGLEQILSSSHETGWEPLWDPHSTHD